jgi:hypothetical protein
MSDDRHGFEDLFRKFAEEVERGIERASDDLDAMARRSGVDPEEARRWIDAAGAWVRGQVEEAGSGPFGSSAPGAPAPGGGGPAGPTERPAGPLRADDPLHGATPHPLDLPTTDQGVALAALDSGRWTLEPGTSILTVRGDGPGPSDAMGLVRELRVRDWLDGEGRMTLAGRRALERWLAVAER